MPLNCVECAAQMNLINDNTLWFCPMGCGSIPNDSPLANAPAKTITLTHFLSFFFGEDEDIYLFGFSPKELPDEIKEIPNKIKTNLSELQTSRTLQNRLKQINETQGLYFTVNFGGTKKEDISRINAAFCEIDDLPIEAQHDLYDHCPLPPSIRVETKKSVHAYWLIGENCSRDEFHTLQSGLINSFGSDKALSNENRVMRLPFFNHVSFDAGEFLYKKVNVHTFSNTAFSRGELLAAFPQTVPEIIEPVRFNEYQMQGDIWQDLFREMQNRFRSLSGYHVEAGGKLASARAMCHYAETNRSLVMNLNTGVIFCRNGCSFDEILTSLNLERPKKMEKRISIPRTAAPVQSSELFRAIMGA